MTVYAEENAEMFERCRVHFRDENTRQEENTFNDAG